MLISRQISKYMSKKDNVAVLGATGAVSETMIQVPAERGFPVDQLYPLASENSVGKSVEFQGKTLAVEDAANFDFSKVQIGLFSAGGDIVLVSCPPGARALAALQCVCCG